MQNFFPLLEDDEKDKNSLDNIFNFSNKEIEKTFIQQRKIFLWGVVDDRSAKEIVNKLLYIDFVDNSKEILFYINSPGGMVTSGMVIYDAMQMIKSPIHTICMGLAASMGSILLSAGKKEHRYIFPHGEVMIHQPSLGGMLQGNASDLEIQAKQIKKTKEFSAKILSQNTGKTMSQIMKDFDRDYWMNAQEAIKYGIVDKVLDNI